MEIALLIGVIGLWVLLGLLFVRIRQEPPAQEDISSDQPDSPGSEIVVREADDAIELWWPGGGRLATVRPVDAKSLGTPLRSPWVRKAVFAMLGRAGKAVKGKPGGTYRLTFPPDLMSSLTSGGTVDVVVGGGGVTAVGRGVAGAALGGPTLAVAVGAVAMSVAQQQRLDRTLAVIEQRLDLLIDRMRDDDHGRLDAAESLLAQIEARSAATPSQQLRAELAAARQSVEAIYFGRRRFGQRLGDAIGDAQDAVIAEGGEAEAWAAGVLEAVGEPAQLRSELLVYLRAVVVRARLATATSGILAMDGDVEDANRLLAETVEELRSDFYGLYRKLRPLAQWAPKRSLPWKRKDWDRAHETVVEVYELMAGEVEPLLPDPEPKPIELEAVVGSSGELDELQIVD